MDSYLFLYYSESKANKTRAHTKLIEVRRVYMQIVFTFVKLKI